MCSIMEDQDTIMCPIISRIAASRVSKSVSASDLEVLAHGVVLLAVKTGLNENIQLVVPTPEPVERVPSEGCDVGHMDPHVVLCVSGLLWRCAM